MSDFEDVMARVRKLVPINTPAEVMRALGELDLAFTSAVEGWMEEIRQLRGEVELGRQARQQLGSLRAELAAARVQIQTVLDRESRAYGNGQAQAYLRMREWAQQREAMARQQVDALPGEGPPRDPKCTCILSPEAPTHRNSNANCELTRAKRRAEGTVMA